MRLRTVSLPGALRITLIRRNVPSSAGFCLFLRRDGLEAYFTIDAGPQVKALCRASDLDAVAERLASLPGVRRVLRAPLNR